MQTVSVWRRSKGLRHFSRLVIGHISAIVTHISRLRPGRAPARPNEPQQVGPRLAKSSCAICQTSWLTPNVIRGALDRSGGDGASPSCGSYLTAVPAPGLIYVMAPASALTQRRCAMNEVTSFCIIMDTQALVALIVMLVLLACLPFELGYLIGRYAPRDRSFANREQMGGHTGNA